MRANHPLCTDYGISDASRTFAKPPRPVLTDAPGHYIRPLKAGHIIFWKARSDLIERGYYPQIVRLWDGKKEGEDVLTEELLAQIATRCRAYQCEMEAWERYWTVFNVMPFDDTVSALIRAYTTDPVSSYHQIRPATRKTYNYHLARIEADHGGVLLADIKFKTLKGWHQNWVGPDKLYPKAHALVTMVRTLFSFGATLLENAQCERLTAVAGKLRVPNSKPRKERLTCDQVLALRRQSHADGEHAMAMAQAFQFEGTFRQKDVIGEWESIAYMGPTDIVSGNETWMRGIRWEEIDDKLILHHVTSKKQKQVDVPLLEAPMVIEELLLRYPGCFYEKEVIVDGEPVMQIFGDRSKLPTSGPIIVDDRTAEPFRAKQFRRRWRDTARAAGVTDQVYNMDSRAGAITEATEAGAELEAIKHAAAHSDIQMTQRYARGAFEKVTGVMRKRAAHRKAALAPVEKMSEAA